MTPDITHLHRIQANRAVRQSQPVANQRALRPVDTLQLSAEVREAAPGLGPGFLAALGQSLKPTGQLPSGAHALIRTNVERALRLRHLSESERLTWLQGQVQAGGAMDYRREHGPERGQRLSDRNCGAVGAALALRQETVAGLAGDRQQVVDGYRESQRYLNGEPSQLGQRGRQQFERAHEDFNASVAGEALARRAGGDPAGAYQAMQAYQGPQRRSAALALAQRLQSRDFRDIPNNPEGNRFLEQLRQQLVNSYVGQPELSPEAAMLSQQLAVTRARRAGSLSC